MGDFSFQLYSSRHFGPLRKTLKMLADLGYDRVEGYEALYASPEALVTLKDALEETGLQMTSGHVGLDIIESAPDAVIRACDTLGMTKVFVPFVGGKVRPADAQGWRAFGERLSVAAAPLRDAGLHFGWHNHDFEFNRLSDGVYPIQALLTGGDFSLELDVAWVVRAGEDPMKWILELSDWIVAAHVKDVAPEGENADEDGWADVGHGRMDWCGLMSALRNTACEIFVVEHDNPNDDFRFARRSVAFLKEL